MVCRRKTKESFYFFDSSEASFRKARQLRKNETKAEAELWEFLRNKQVIDLKFRRQHPVASFIVDFYCHEALLVIELEGTIHNDPEVAERDEIRRLILEEKGLRILRFKNEEVLNDIQSVLHQIKKTIDK